MQTVEQILCGEATEPEAHNLRPIVLLADFLAMLRHPETAAMHYGDDPDAYFDLLNDVELMQVALAALVAPKQDAA